MNVPELTPAQEFYLALEAERHNLTYLSANKPTPGEAIRWIEKPCTKKHTSTARDEAFYHAGRYAAGARDSRAIEAQQQLEDLLGNE